MSRDGGTDLLLAEAQQEGIEGAVIIAILQMQRLRLLWSQQYGEGLDRCLPHPKSALRSCSKQVLLGGLPQGVRPWVALQVTSRCLSYAALPTGPVP